MPIDRANYPNIPADFPIEATLSALTGAQPKLSLVEEDGKYYAVGTSPSEVAELYDICEDLAQQSVAYCTRKISELSLTREEVIERLLQGLYQKQWVAPVHSQWIAVRTKHLLGWETQS
jgi:hypothetical protein